MLESKGVKEDRRKRKKEQKKTEDGRGKRLKA